MGSQRLQTVDEVIFQHVMYALEECDWNVSEAARALIVSHKSIHRWLRQWLKSGRIAKTEKVGYHNVYEPAHNKGEKKSHG